MFRSQTDEQLAAWWDKEPWACYQVVTRDGGKTWERVEVQRHAEEHEGDVHFVPRVECIPSRIVMSGTWALGMERPPVNPILVAFRNDVNKSGRDTALIQYLAIYARGPQRVGERLRFFFGEEATDHARKVLTRLATLS